MFPDRCIGPQFPSPMLPSCTLYLFVYLAGPSGSHLLWNDWVLLAYGCVENVNNNDETKIHRRRHAQSAAI